MSINARFEHLDTGQRNRIFHAMHGGPARKVARLMARRYGVSVNAINRAYVHVHNQRRRKGLLP